MSEIDLDQLASIYGGMQWEGMPPSTNVEDRRGWTRRQSMSAPVIHMPPPRWNHVRGDLADQAGYSDIDGLAKRLRAQRRR